MSHPRPPSDGSTLNQTNIESFSSQRSLNHYSDRATVGLFPHEREAIDRYFDKPDARVLDVGCGTGRTTYPLYEMGYDVIGIDVSDEMVDRAAELFPEIPFRVGDATDLDFGTDRFDYALFSHNGLDYVHPESARVTALRELGRVLKPDGLLVFSTHNGWYRYPAFFFDRQFLRTFYLNEGNFKRLFRRYKIDVLGSKPLWTYLSDPIRQRRQLRRCGFDPVELIGKRDSFLKLFEAMLYYVARVDDEP